MAEANNNIALRVKRGSAEIEIHCLKSDIGNLLQIAEKYLNLLSKTSFITDTAEKDIEKQEEELLEVPSISAKKLPESIHQLLENNWGKLPRTANEIKEALEINALHYPITSIAATLNRLTKKGMLRRLKKDKVFSYVLAKKSKI